jgi:hypothetical protein
VVTATKTGDSTYLAVSSAPTTVTFTVVPVVLGQPTISQTSADGVATIVVNGGVGRAGQPVELYYRSGLTHKVVSIGHGFLGSDGIKAFIVHFGHGQHAKVYARVGASRPYAYTKDLAFVVS